MERVRQMQRIKELRKEKSMNQIALGTQLNFSQKIISEYENGKVEPSITTLKKLASIFNKAQLIVANIILFVSCLHTIRLTNEVRRYSMTIVLRSL